MTPETAEGNLDKIVETIKDQVLDKIKVVKPRTDFEFLAKFIRAKKYNANAAVEAIWKYYSGIHCRVDAFEGIHVCDFAHVLNSGLLKFFKSPFQNVTIVYMSVDLWNPHEVTLQELMLAVSFLIEQLLLNPNFQIHGLMGIINLQGLSFAHLKHLTYSQLKFAINLFFDIFPVRIAAIHFLNTPIVFWPIYKIMEKFFPLKIRQRMKLHRDVEGLENFVPSESLPKTLGGKLEEAESWDEDLVPNLLKQNPCYDNYWRQRN